MPQDVSIEDNNLRTLDNRLDHELSFQQSTTSTCEEENSKESPPLPEQRPVLLSKEEYRIRKRLDRPIYHPSGIHSARLR